MELSQPQPASELRKRFMAFPQEQRDANQDFSVRVWRGLSWLERSEAAPDIEGRLISLWISFNAIYGHLDDDGRNAQDRASWQAFLACMVKHDTNDHLGMIIREQRDSVLPLIDNRYIFRPFWSNGIDWEDKLRQAVRRYLRDYNGDSGPSYPSLAQRQTSPVLVSSRFEYQLSIVDVMAKDSLQYDFHFIDVSDNATIFICDE